jgi:hypothetical protein
MQMQQMQGQQIDPAMLQQQQPQPQVTDEQVQQSLLEFLLTVIQRQDLDLSIQTNSIKMLVDSYSTWVHNASMALQKTIISPQIEQANLQHKQDALDFQKYLGMQKLQQSDNHKQLDAIIKSSDMQQQDEHKFADLQLKDDHKQLDTMMNTGVR